MQHIFLSQFYIQKKTPSPKAKQAKYKGTKHAKKSRSILHTQKTDNLCWHMAKVVNMNMHVQWNAQERLLHI